MPLELACGQCVGCRLERKRWWAIRCVHEAKMHERSCFLTLTYDNEHLPEDHSLDVSHWQKFAKRLRKKLGPFRFMHCGEYGDETHRPHYHALIFGHDFSEDSVPLRTNNAQPLRASATLQELWPHGFASIGQVTFDSAAYVASYCTKKKTGEQSESEYERLDPETGEVWSVKPEYATMSRRPGLGTSFFEKYCSDIYPDNFVEINGQKFKPPAFYDELLKKRNPELAQKMKEQRRKTVRDQADNHTPERLAVREKVAKARLTKQVNKTLA